jgi:hypothetical protein
MRSRRLLGYRDAVRLLGGDPPVLAALDRPSAVHCRWPRAV